MVGILKFAAILGDIIRFLVDLPALSWSAFRVSGQCCEF
jgi:hypothetical protein